MSPSGSGSILGGLAMGAGRKLGGMVSNQVNGANMVHAVAIQGLFNAHAQQQSHEHHLKSIKAAQKISGGQGFSVRTGEHSLSVGKGRGGAAPAGTSEPAKPGTAVEQREGGRPAEDHYENGRRFADGMHDRMNDIRNASTSANDMQAAQQGSQGEIAKARLAITAKPQGSTGGNPVKDISRSAAGKPKGMGMVDRTKTGKVNNRLTRLEEKHLAERKASQTSVPNQSQTVKDEG